MQARLHVGSGTRLLGRALAIAIAVGGIIDPAITSDRPAKRIVIVSASDSVRDVRLTDVVENRLRRQFDVARAPIAGASATVIVGDRLPRANDNFPTPAFVIVADSSEPRVELDRIDVPSSATLDERVAVRAVVSVFGAAGRPVDLTVRAGGAVVDRVTSRVAGDSTLVVPLSFVPTSTGPVVIRVSASIGGTEAPAVADAVVNVVDRRRSILFYDPRPSWMSTFVRRGHEPRRHVAECEQQRRTTSVVAGRSIDPRALRRRRDWHTQRTLGDGRRRPRSVHAAARRQCRLPTRRSHARPIRAPGPQFGLVVNAGDACRVRACAR
jgi:hypothetical protein